jgi:pimeloyl-ACP methyl ester carboxylesterase
MKHFVPTPTRRGLLAGAAALVAAASWPLQGLCAAPEAGFETVDLDWRDPERQRDVPVRLYLPQAPALAARDLVPVVVFSHGIGGSRTGYRYLGEHFAAHGVASLHLQHVGSDRRVWTGGNMFSMISRLQEAAQDREAIARALDLRFALDRLLASDFAPRLDARHIVAAGHSYGANTALLAAGARVEREGRVVDLRDPRVGAAIIISAPPFYGDGDPRPILAGVQVPSLHVTATADVINIPGYYSGASDRVALFDAMAHRAKWLAVFEGGSHSMFTDRAGSGGLVLNAQVKTATKELSLAFLKKVFDGQAGELESWPRRHAAIVARFTAAG